jgi:Spy/CpxP family protein refolding chaperone
MMINFKKSALIVVGIFSILFAANVYALDKNYPQAAANGALGERHKMMGEQNQKMWDDLNLTPEQKKAIDANKATNMENTKASLERMRSYRESLKEELMKPELDMNKINIIQSQIKALEAEITDTRLNSVLEVRKILTREQFEKFISFMGKRREFNSKK